MNKSSSIEGKSSDSLCLKTNELEFLLNQIKYPVTLWKHSNKDFVLFYLNDSAKNFQTSVSFLPGGINLKSLIPDDLEKILENWESNAENLNQNYLLEKEIFHSVKIKIKPVYPSFLIIQFEIKDPIQKYFFEESNKTFIEQNPLSIIITDTCGNIEYVNPKFIELTGYTLEEVLGKTPRILKSGNKPAEEYKILWDTILAGGVWKGEFINKKKNGSSYIEFAVISPVKNQSGEITNFIALKEDITELRKIEEDLRRSEKLAGIGKMTAYISHEIKTPLTSIKINVDLLRQNNSVNPEAKKSFLIIEKEMSRLMHSLKNILQFSNQPSLNFTNINLFKKIENIHEFLKPMLTKRGITLNNKTSEHYIYGDAQQLRSLFIHLIENSAESISTSGEIEIYSEMKGTDCCIFIKDTGCGIADKENIFEPFFTTKPAGTGLGLAIVKNIVDKHHGTIELISSKCGETIFQITLQSRGGEIGKVINN